MSGPPSSGKIVGPGDFEAPPPISNTEAALFAPRDFWTHRAVSAADTKIGVEVYYTPGDEGATFDDGAAFFSGAAFDGASDGDILVRDCGRSGPSGRGRPSADRAGYAHDTLKALGALARKAAEGGSAALTSRGGVPGGDASRRSLDASEEAATGRRRPGRRARGGVSRRARTSRARRARAGVESSWRERACDDSRLSRSSGQATEAVQPRRSLGPDVSARLRPRKTKGGGRSSEPTRPAPR